MLKFLLILSIAAYLIFKVGGLFFKAGAAAQQFRNQQRKNDLNVDPKSNGKKKDFKGGEYIDYEEVK